MSKNQAVFKCTIKLTYYVTTRALRTIERKTDRDVRVNFDVISYEVQTNDFLNIAVKKKVSLNIPANWKIKRNTELWHKFWYKRSFLRVFNSIKQNLSSSIAFILFNMQWQLYTTAIRILILTLYVHSVTHVRVMKKMLLFRVLSFPHLACKSKYTKHIPYSLISCQRKSTFWAVRIN